MKEKKVMHIASLVCGIISILFMLYWYIAIPTGICAIVFGAKSANRYASKIGKAGLILGIIGLTIFTYIYIGLLLLLLFIL